jgi:hypothetical protein
MRHPARDWSSRFVSLLLSFVSIHIRHTSINQVCPRERIGVSAQQQNAEVLHSRHSFENPFAPKAPRVLTPETIITERISGTDPNEFVPRLGPDFGHVSVGVTLPHRSPHHGSSHHESSIKDERQILIWTWGRDQLYASKAEQQPPQYPKVRLLLNGLAKTTVQNTLLFFGHDEIASLAKKTR